MLLLTVLVFICVDIWASYNWLAVREYECRLTEVRGDVRLVVLSDLHGHEFGKQNERLIGKVRSQQPDLVLLDGDFLNEDSESSDDLCRLIEALSEFAPVYFSFGNHEEQYMKVREEDLEQKLEAAGAEVLEKEYVDLDINGSRLRLGGMYEYAFGLNGENDASAVPIRTGEFLRDFQNTDRVRVMMAHRPDSFIFGDAASYWDIDLVVSGHDHGGQVNVPFYGGLYGGDQGWFPKYVHGMHQKDALQIFITSGLGSNHQKLPRFHNLPEIAVVTIKGENE